MFMISDSRMSNEVCFGVGVDEGGEMVVAVSIERGGSCC
jgi:hypothetical protein